MDAALAHEGGGEAAVSSNPLLAQSFRKTPAGDDQLVSVGVKLNTDVIALGASAATHYPPIANMVGVALTVPDHADVAGAVGAAAGSVRQRVMVSITQPAETKFRIHLADGPIDKSSLDDALAAARIAAKQLAEARAKGETLTRRVQTGFDPETGKPIHEEEILDLAPLPFIVVLIDEVADLMLVAGKEIEGAVQRLAQMARAAGIHVIMATQRPSVDVITGTIKANFPTRISFQVTSRIDSRTILGEQGAEQLLGRGDMLFMEGGGRVVRVHGPFVDDGEVEAVANFLRQQGEPEYDDRVVEEVEIGGDGAADGAVPSNGGSLYEQAVALVVREQKASTSFVQRHLKIGYNRAATIIEEMESNGIISAANHVGKRDVLLTDSENGGL